MAAVPHNAVDQDAAFANLRRLLFARVDGDVLDFARPLDVAVLADFGILDDQGVLDDGGAADGAVVAAAVVHGVLGDLLEPLLQQFVVDVFGPHVGVGGDDAVKRQDGAFARLVHQFDLHAHLLRLPFLDNAVAEFGMVGGGDLLDVEKDAHVADDVVGDVVHLVHGHVVADVAVHDVAVGDADGQPQVVVLQHLVADGSDAHQSVEVVAVYQCRVERVAYQHIVPIVGDIVVLN